MIQNATITDQSLILRSGAGDLSATEILLGRYRNTLHTMIRLLIKDSHTAEDILQEVLIKINTQLLSSRYQEKGLFIHWASQIARHACMDYFRRSRAKKRVEVNEDDLSSCLNSINHTSDSPEGYLIGQERKVLLADAINHLPEKQRQVILMRHFEQKTFREIALITDCSINTVLGRMRYGIKNLRKLTDANI